jgi:D-alanyl-D-alanine carboxypeptidase
MAQATGQFAFELEAVKRDVFQFTMAGLVMDFNPAEKTLKLQQGGGEFLFKKE